MEGLRSVGYLFGHRHLRAAADIESDIDQELDAHIAYLTEDCLAEGMQPEEARREAERRFGSRQHYHDRCREIDMKDHMLLNRIVLVFTALLAGMFAGLSFLLFFEIKSMRRQHADSIAELSGSLSELQAADKAIEAHLAGPVMKDVAGRVVDETGAPLSDIDLLIVVKTWPDGVYRQRAYHAVSDADGAYSLEKLLPTGEQHAVHVAALRGGYALTSKYESRESGAEEAVGPLLLKLEPARPVQLALEDAEGNRIKDAKIAPASRTTDDDQTHVIYFQASQLVHTTTDENGQFALDWCASGDQAELYVQLPGGDWESYSVKMPVDDAESLVLTIRNDGE